MATTLDGIHRNPPEERRNCSHARQTDHSHGHRALLQCSHQRLRSSRYDLIPTLPCVSLTLSPDLILDPSWNRSKEAIPSTVPVGKMASDGEGYRLTRLREDQILVDFDQGSPQNPVNWSHVSDAPAGRSIT